MKYSYCIQIWRFIFQFLARKKKKNYRNFKCQTTIFHIDCVFVAREMLMNWKVLSISRNKKIWWVLVFLFFDSLNQILMNWKTFTTSVCWIQIFIFLFFFSFIERSFHTTYYLERWLFCNRSIVDVPKRSESSRT